MGDYVRGLRRIAYCSMVLCSALGLSLWAIGDLPLMQVEFFRATAAAAATYFVLYQIFRFARPKLRPHIHTPLLKQALERLPETLELLLFFSWVPLAVTFTSYVVLPWSLPLVDSALAYLDIWLGLPHYKTYDWFQKLGLLPLLQKIYATIDYQILLMFAYWLLVRRNLTRVYEYTAIASFLGLLSVGCLWAFPAEGPWQYFNGLYTAPPDIPSYIPALQALRDHQYIDDGTPHGFLNFPSFHTVFAMLLIYSMRGTGWPMWIVVPLNISVIIATVPIGWHYLIDIPGGIVFTGFGIWFIRRFALPLGQLGVQAPGANENHASPAAPPQG